MDGRHDTDDEKILTFDIPDEALERAGSPEREASTWVYCTNGYYWYDCNFAIALAAWRYSPRGSGRRRRSLNPITHVSEPTLA